MSSLIRRTGVLALACLLLVASTAPALAQPSANWSDQFYEETKPLVEKYNENVERVPGVIRNQLGGEQVEVVVKPSGGGDDAVYSVALTDDGSIDSFEKGHASNPTYRVTTTQAAIEEIRNAEDKQKAFWSVYDRGDFEIAGLTLGTSAKVSVVETGAKLFADRNSPEGREGGDSSDADDERKSPELASGQQSSGDISTLLLQKKQQLEKDTHSFLVDLTKRIAGFLNGA
jgi:hypothetical protein